MPGEITPLGQAYRAYEQLEGQLSAAFDRLVATNGFADLLATSATNVMALTRLANGTVDRFVRSTRLAARSDVTDVARQLARTEAKLERLLQAVQELQAQLDRAATGTAMPEEVPEPSEASGPPGSPARDNGSAKARASSSPVRKAVRAR